MPLVNMKALLGIARKNDLLLPAYNTTNLETTLAIMEAFETNGMPGIVQIAPTNIRLSGYDFISEIARLADERCTVPMALHLDHGKSLEDVRQAVRAGFASIMFDGAALPFEQNIRLTRRVVDFCHCSSVFVEAELGAIRGKEDDAFFEADSRTDPHQVVEFVDRTGCDLLAVSIGNVHGLAEKPDIDLDHLAKIAAIAPCPLVLHGGSGIPYDTIVAMKRYNVVKINIASELRRAYISSVGSAYDQNNNETDLVKVLLDARSAVAGVARVAQLAMNGMGSEREFR